MRTKSEEIRFGPTPEEQTDLAGLVLKGVKTATSSLVDWNLFQQRSASIVGDRWKILDGNSMIVCEVEVVKVYECCFGKVDEFFAEAEGDGTFENWYAIHKPYYSALMERLGKKLTTESLLECVYFERINS